MDGEIWSTVEHYYQAQKSLDPAYKDAIRNAKSPGAAKRLGRLPTGPSAGSRKSWFEKNSQSPRADWETVKLDVMRRADLAKFTQHTELRALLLSTQEAELVEDSTTEPFWGIGPDGHGMNWAGRILMGVRQQLRLSGAL